MWPDISSRLWEKNVDFDAVIGVVGVFALARFGGGVTVPLEFEAASLRNAAIFAAVGVLRGSKLSGGSRNGCKCFFFGGARCPCCSASDPAPMPCCILEFELESTFLGSLPDDVPDSSLVELLFRLFILLESNGRLDFRAANIGGSAGDSFGDSYAFGIAGTGGTSSSSFPAELWTFLDFGVGSLEVDGTGSKRGWGCSDPVDDLGVNPPLDPVETPYVLRLKSGVLRKDDGVVLMRGRSDGERDDALRWEGSC